MATSPSHRKRGQGVHNFTPISPSPHPLHFSPKNAKFIHQSIQFQFLDLIYQSSMVQKFHTSIYHPSKHLLLKVRLVSLYHSSSDLYAYLGARFRRKHESPSKTLNKSSIICGADGQNNFHFSLASDSKQHFWWYALNSSGFISTVPSSKPVWGGISFPQA